MATKKLPNLRSNAERNRLVVENLRLVPYFLKTDNEAALQGGAEGLMRAMELWDPEKGEISTYARRWIIQGAQRATRCAELSRPNHRVKGCEHCVPPVSLNQPYLKGDEEGDERIDHVADRDAIGTSEDSPVDEIAIARAIVSQMLGVLTKRQLQAVTLYFGLGDRDPITLEEAGAVMGVSRERVRQHVAKAIAKMRLAAGVEMGS